MIDLSVPQEHQILRNTVRELNYEGTNEIQKLIQTGYVLGYRKDTPLRCDLSSA